MSEAFAGEWLEPKEILSLLDNHPMPFTLIAECGDGLTDDDALIPSLHAAAVACGAQSITEYDQRRCIRLCRAHGVDVGAAPDTIDRATLGTRIAIVDAESLAATVQRQASAFRRLCADEGATMRFVRLRGALQAFASTDPDVAAAISAAIVDFDPTLTLVAPAESRLFLAARRARLQVAGEVFVDRVYETDGTLRGRGIAGAFLDDFEASLNRAHELARHHCIRAHDGSRLFVEAAVLALDPHAPRAAARARFLKRELPRLGVACGGIGNA